MPRFLCAGTKLGGGAGRLYREGTAWGRRTARAGVLPQLLDGSWILQGVGAGGVGEIIILLFWCLIFDESIIIH